MRFEERNIGSMADHQQISDTVEFVTKRIKEYNGDNDSNILEKLKDICKKEKMTVDMAKMHRNIGMYHFYLNNCSKAIMSMQKSVDLLRRENCTNLLLEYYSELGYIYFYHHEYLLSQKYHEKAEELLLQVSDIERRIVFLHYYRYGVLLSNMQEYHFSELKLEKALLYVESHEDTGLIIMSIGILYKRQKDFKAALRYFSKALYLLNDEDMKIKSKVYNNIADVYKILGQYGKALRYIDKAFGCITDNDMSLLFTCFNTYTEIKLLMGERESVLEKFLKLLVRVEDFHLYKGQIIQGINNMIVIGSEDRDILERLEGAIIELIEGNTYENEEYIKELKAHLGSIKLCLKDLKTNMKYTINIQ